MRSLILLVALVFSGAAAAMAPETGIYWNPRYPGWAIYVEQQRDTIFAVVYAYSEVDGEPEFYVSSGPIIGDIPFDADPSYAGLFPIDGFGSALFRVPSGSCLGCVYAPISPSLRVGSLQIAFVSRDRIYMSAFFLNGRRFPSDGTSQGVSFQRFNFALGSVTDQNGVDPAWPDMRGEWVFTDETDRMRVPWRFEFTTQEIGVNLGSFPVRGSAVYRDESRNAILYCFITDPTGMTPAQFNALPESGCELRQGGTTLFSTPREIAIDDFVGSLGPLPNRGARIYRGSQRVLGRRLSK